MAKSSNKKKKSSIAKQKPNIAHKQSTAKHAKKTNPKKAITPKNSSNTHAAKRSAPGRGASKASSFKNKKTTVKTSQKKTSIKQKATTTTTSKQLPESKVTFKDAILINPKELFSELKDFIQYEIQTIKEEVDPEKLKELKKILIKGSSYFVGIAAITAIVLVLEVYSHNRIFPGTKVGSVDIGYLPIAEAEEKISAEVQNYLKEPLIFSYEGNTVGVSAEEIGLKIGIDQTLARAPIFEFEKENPAYMAAVLLTQRNTPINYTVDGDQIIKTLEKKFNLTDKRAKNAKIVLNENNFEIQPESNGVAIDRQALIKTLRKNIDALSTQTITIALKEEKPRITAQELGQKKDELIALLENPITLTTENHNLTLKLTDHLDAVSFEEKNTLRLEGQSAVYPVILKDSQVNLAHANPIKINSSIQIALDEDKLAQYLDENMLNNLEKPVEPANIYTDEAGEVVIDGKGRDGKSVPKNRLTEAIALAANNNISKVPVPILTDHAPLTISDNLKELGIKELLTTGHSAYYGSPPNRMFNIEFGSQKFNGTLIAPGEEFSFNELLGPVDGASGFRPEKVIKKNELVYEYGGGICQVSTTMYRAVLQAGLPITARKPHSWKVSYYAQSMGDGLDATIYPGVSDLKFINDTKNHILIQAYTESAENYFKIYGTDDGRKVELDGPYGAGLTYRWNYSIQLPGEEAATTREIWSRYKPIPPPKPKEPAPVESSAGGESIADGF